MANRKRPHPIKVYLSNNELETLKTLLKGFNGSRSDFIRKSILNANTTNLNALEDMYNELLRQHKAIGNNINQLTRSVNQGRCKIENNELQAIRKELDELWQLLKSLKVGEV